MKLTKKSINSALDSKRYYNSNYVMQGFSGIIENQKTLEKVIVRILASGSVSIRSYGFGDAEDRDDYNMSGKCADITEIITDYVWNNTLTRKGAVNCIYEQLNQH